MVKAATQAKDLTNPRPGSGQKVVEFSRGNQGSLFNPTMTGMNGLCRAPIAAIDGRFAEKELQILFERGLNSLGKRDTPRPIP